MIGESYSKNETKIIKYTVVSVKPNFLAKLLIVLPKKQALPKESIIACVEKLWFTRRCLSYNVTFSRRRRRNNT